MFVRTALLLLAPAALLSANPISLSQSSPRALSHDDVVVLHEDGSTAVMKDYEYTNLKLRAESANKAFLADTKARRDKGNNKDKRGCEQSSEVQVLTDDTFLNWDVPMSSVVSALGGTSQVGIMEGYSISNSMTATVSADLTLIEEVLSASFSMSYSETWTTSTTSVFTFTVPANQYGLIVSEPSVRRLTGNYLTGCTDSWDKSTFTSDTYTSQSYGGMQWPSGVIRLCNSSSYPVPYCVGDGTHS